MSGSESESADEHEQDTPSGMLYNEFPDYESLVSLFISIAFTTRTTETDMIEQPKVVVSLSQLRQLIPTRCILQGCDDTLTTAEKFRGCGIVIRFKCSKGHTFTWSSSPEHLDGRGQSVYSNNLLMSAACLTSGNSNANIELFCRFMKVISEAMYYIRYVHEHNHYNYHYCATTVRKC